MRNGLLIFVILLTGCERPKPAISNEDYALAVSENPGLTDACKAELRETGTSGMANDRCYKMGPPQRWRGVWNSRLGMEQFLPCAGHDVRRELRTK